MREAFLVFVGGGAGSVLRWLTGLFALRHFGATFPVGTLAVNVIGCFVMGLLFRALPAADAGPTDARLLLMTGVLGGFTTFSAFALDAAGLWMRGEQGPALGYIAATFAATLAGVSLGLIVGRWVTA